MGQSDSRQQPQQPHSSSSNHNNYHLHHPTTDTDSSSTNFTTATATSAIHSEHPLNNNDHMTDATFNNNNNNNPTPSLAMPSLHAPHLNGGPSQLLSNDQLISLRRELPSTQRMHDDWILLYSSRKMGTSIKQFTERCLNRGPTLILIRDTFGRVFGSFASQDWKRNGQFFGDSNCFLFTFDPSFATSVAPQNNNGAAAADDDDTTFTADTAHQEPGIQVFRSSNRNENYMYFNEGNEFNEYNGLALGGRMNFFCLSLDRTFSRGTSRPGLLTYNFSPCLCTDVYDVDDAPDDLDQYHFIVDQIEVWGFPLSESQMLDLQFKLNQKQARVAAVKGDDADYFIMENAGMVGSGANFRVEQKTDEQKMKDAGL